MSGSHPPPREYIGNWYRKHYVPIIDEPPSVGEEKRMATVAVEQLQKVAQEEEKAKKRRELYASEESESDCRERRVRFYC